MPQCKTCKQDSKVTIQDECYPCIRLDPQKEARLREHYARFDADGPLPEHPTFFDWLIAPAIEQQETE